MRVRRPRAKADDLDETSAAICTMGYVLIVAGMIAGIVLR